MTCPNGHKGGVFCCEDHVNLIMKEFYEKYKDWKPLEHPLIPVTKDQYDAYLLELNEGD